ncbi:hypothetical protein QFC22_002676 [Naganishia vaughanmartiniae]|uniref:Uncharacterized protein n=1 Tax=Naganishia vaughanmartiniae TaxID=1424756 RepID=A0ACC2X9N4_9TREE|nr:hypothetical protein QFC22_002676 [Naganishia vaughanmartiniae]
MQRPGPDTYPWSPSPSANEALEQIPTGAPLNTHGLLDDGDIEVSNTQSTQKSTWTADSGTSLFLPFQSNRSVDRPSYASDTTIQDADHRLTAEVDQGKRWSDSVNTGRHINNHIHINGRPDQSLDHQSNGVARNQSTQHYASVSSTSTGDHTEETTRMTNRATHRSTTPERTKISGEHHTTQNGEVTARASATAYPPASDLIVRTKKRRYTNLQNQPLQDTHFFLNGRLMTGGDRVWPLLGSVVLLLGLGGLWLGTTGVWIWRDGLGGGGAGRGGKAAVIIFGYLLGVCFGAMMATAFRDPGESPKLKPRQGTTNQRPVKSEYGMAQSAPSIVRLANFTDLLGAVTVDS